MKWVKYASVIWQLFTLSLAGYSSTQVHDWNEFINTCRLHLPKIQNFLKDSSYLPGVEYGPQLQAFFLCTMFGKDKPSFKDSSGLQVNQAKDSVADCFTQHFLAGLLCLHGKFPDQETTTAQ